MSREGLWCHRVWYRVPFLLKDMKRVFVVSLALFVWLCIVLQAQELFSLHEAQNDVSILASPEFAGRGYYKGGGQRAASYILRRFKELGLSSVNGCSSQRFLLRLNVITEGAFLFVNEKEFQIGKDFFPHSLTSSGTYEGVVQAYYVGSGLILPEKKLNDFSTVTNSNGVILIDESVPDSIRNDTTIAPERYSREARIEYARTYNPRVILFLSSRLFVSSPHTSMGIPMFSVLKDRVPTDVHSIRFHVDSRKDSIEAENILGLIEGSVAPDSFLVFCAHYDHHGGYCDSLYFPGANDNASGIALMLQLAKAIVQQPLRYSVLFIAFGGEEIGLVGSRYFVENPFVPLSKIVFVYNFDMVGSGDGSIMVVGGEEYPSEYSFLAAVADSFHIPISKRKTSPGSDHYPFAQRGVPAFFFYANNGKQPYHSFDDKPETLDWKAFENVYRVTTTYFFKRWK